MIEQNSLEPLLKVRNLRKTFINKKQTLIAVDNLDLTLYPGETLGLVGESGCGKSTVGKTILRLHEPDSGSIVFEGTDICSLSSHDLKVLRRKMQAIFQDPYASLNPRMTVLDIVGEALDIHKLAKGRDRLARVEELLHLVGLNPEHINRFPHEFSGGQRQRLSIARALAVQPKFLVCDEPLAALDASIQAQIVNLLKKLQRECELTYLFIAHDLAMVQYIADRVAVMYLGAILELAPSSELYQNPLHPYTQVLLSAIPIPDPQVERNRSRIIVHGEIPSSTHRPTGCIFHTRCPYAMPICKEKAPDWREVEPNHFAACHLLD